jgi:hypothetical protein
MQTILKGVVCTPKPDVEFRRDHDGFGMLTPLRLKLFVQHAFQTLRRLFLAGTRTFEIEDEKRVCKSIAFARQQFRAGRSHSTVAPDVGSELRSDLPDTHRLGSGQCTTQGVVHVLIRHQDDQVLHLRIS